MRLAFANWQGQVQESSIDPSRLAVMRDLLLQAPSAKSGVGKAIAPKNAGNDNAAKDPIQKADDQRQRAEAKALV